MAKEPWRSLKGQAGIQVRTYQSGEKTYRFKQQIGSKVSMDYFGCMDEGEVLKLVAELRANRRQGFGPQTYKELVAERTEVEKQEYMEEVAERKKVLEEEIFRTVSTVAQFWDTVYWPVRKDKGAEKPTKGLLTSFNKFWRPTIGEVSLFDLEDEQINDVVSSILKMKSERIKDRLLSERTAEHARTTLSGMYNEAIVYFRKKANGGRVLRPFPKSELGKIKNQKTCFITEEEFDELVVELKKHKNRDAHDMAILSAYTGLRFGDVATLKWSDINVEGITFLDTKKDKDTVPINFLLKPIFDMLQERDAIALQAKPYELIFTNSFGIAYKQCPRNFYKAVKTLGFNEKPHRLGKSKERINFHSLRHTFASWLIQNGVQIQVVQRLLGHSDSRMTEVYARLKDDNLANVTQVLVKK